MTTTALDPAQHHHDEHHHDEQHHHHQPHHAHGHDHHGPAAWVGEQPIEVAAVDAEVTRLRNGPRAALLPVAESSEGRQLRRWVTQTLVARALLEQEARLRGLVGEPPPAAVLPDRLAATALGGVLASVLRSSGPARAVYVDVTSEVAVTAAEAFAYVERSEPAVPGSSPEQPAPVSPSDSRLVEATARLLAARGRQVFLDWLSGRTAELVRLEPGHEHPGDPHQPDATHRH